MMPAKTDVVSFEDEPLIVVDSDDNVLGYETKGACHDGDGKLHRAFSVFLFDGGGRLLLHRRSGTKRLWGGFWTNSCCSHPRRGEEVGEAAHRRIREELGVETALTYTYRFEYHARFGDLGSEHELCSVFVGRHDGELVTNTNEIAEVRWVEPGELDGILAADPEDYSPWLKLEWPVLRRDHWSTVEAMVAEPGEGDTV